MIPSAGSFTPARFALLCFAIFCSLAFLLGRVAWLQIIKPDNLVKQEDMRSLREVAIDAPRGMIMDREGRPLAVSVPVRAVWADPKTVLAKGGVGFDDRWQALASALHLSLSTLASRINSNPQGRFIYLARQVDPAQAQWIDKLNLPGINLRDESRRFYPAGHVAANLIGFTNIDGQGIEGVEKSFNAQLMGKAGVRQVREDRYGRVVENLTEVAPVPAHNIQLSIDERLQTITEDALDNAVAWNKAESGASVLINIPTGGILAMASYPDFNPNNREGATLNDFRNRAISDTFEPGSTVKPLVLMTALQQGLVQLDGQTITDASHEIAAHDGMPYTVQGQLWHYYSRACIVLHKPAGTECSQKPSAWPSVYTLLPAPLRHAPEPANGPASRRRQTQPLETTQWMWMT